MKNFNACHSEEQASRKKKEYQEKCSVLASFGPEVPPERFINEALPDAVVVVAQRGFRNGKVWKTTKEELIDVLPVLAVRNDIYVCYSEYFRGWYRGETMKRIHAFVVDVDLVPPDLLKWFMQVMVPKMKIKPTYVFASGEGTQFIYQLQEPADVFKRRKESLKELYRRLQMKFWTLASMGKKKRYKTKLDIHSLTQPFRLPGTATKLGTQSRVYRCGEPVTIKDLAEWLRVDLSAPQTKKTKRNNRFWKQDVIVIPNAFGGRSFYDYAFEKAVEEVMPGHRYLSLFALSVIAWKCRVPFKELKQDLETLIILWESRHEHLGVEPLKPGELEKALRGYNPRATLVSCDTLEKWMGIQLKKEPKRRMPREEQVQLWRKAGSEARQRKKQERMREVVELRNKGLSWSKIARKVGISRNRASELYREALQGVR